MGAHDWIDEAASCPRCDRTHACQIQFDFRFPDYRDAAHLRRGEWVAGPDLELSDVTGSGYVRVRALEEGPVIVAEPLDLYGIVCPCAAPLVAGVAVDVDLTRLRMRLVGLRWLDAASFRDPSVLPPAHYVPEEWATEHDGKASIPPSHEGRRAVFSEHLRRVFAS